MGKTCVVHGKKELLIYLHFSHHDGVTADLNLTPPVFEILKI
jgi:hypothetical protein